MRVYTFWKNIETPLTLHTYVFIVISNIYVQVIFVCKEVVFLAIYVFTTYHQHKKEKMSQNMLWSRTYNRDITVRTLPVMVRLPLCCSMHTDLEWPLVSDWWRTADGPRVNVMSISGTLNGKVWYSPPYRVIILYNGDNGSICTALEWTYLVTRTPSFVSNGWHFCGPNKTKYLFQYFRILIFI